MLHTEAPPQSFIQSSARREEREIFHTRAIANAHEGGYLNNAIRILLPPAFDKCIAMRPSVFVLRNAVCIMRRGKLRVDDIYRLVD